MRVTLLASVIESAQGVHHIVNVGGLFAVWRPSQGCLAFNRIGVRGPRGQYRSPHFRFELRMVHHIKGVSKTGEGHWFASFLPILFQGDKIAAWRI
jgi:hypothetical protein